MTSFPWHRTQKLNSMENGADVIPWYVNDPVVEEVSHFNLKVAKTREGAFRYTGAFIDLNATRTTASGKTIGLTCDLKCPWCYNDVPHNRPTESLTLDQIKRIVGFVKSRGGKVVVHAGFGEPLMDPVFLPCLENSFREGLSTVLYTNGSFITAEVARALYEQDATVVIKRTSLDPRKQDEMVGSVKGYSDRMWRGFDHLLKAGFTTPRLAVDSLICNENLDEIPDMLRFCRDRDIIPYFETFITTSPAVQDSGYEPPSVAMIDSLFLELQEIDRAEYNRETRLVPGMRVYGVNPCRKYLSMFNVRCNGDVALAPHTPALGNIEKQDLGKILVPENNEIRRHLLQGCQCSAVTSVGLLAGCGASSTSATPSAHQAAPPDGAERRLPSLRVVWK